MRDLKGPVFWLAAALAVSASLFHLWTGGFGFMEPREQRSVHLLLLLPLAFLLYPATEHSPKDRPSVIDAILCALAILPCLYSLGCANGGPYCASIINLRFETVDPVFPIEWVLGTIAVVLVLEALRRAVTPILAGLVALGIIYLFVTEYMPGILFFRDIPATQIVETLYLFNSLGIFGSITGISATMVAMFIIFGAFIEGSGVGRLFHNLGMKVAGRQAGGPAKVEVVSSALFGTISGSSVANVFATGSFTIPAMIKLGYRKQFAAGVEAASSVGGQIMPPVMGAGAFIMAEITNIPYQTIAIGAIAGSLLYFFMILISVHFEAKRLRLVGCDPSEIPDWSEVVKDAHLLLPVFVMVGAMGFGYSPAFSAFWGVVTMVPASWLRHHTRLYPADVLRMLAVGGRNMVVVALACAGAGMFVACLTVTGMVISFSTIVTGLAGSNLYLAGILIAITVLILGMGVPTTAAYIIGAAIGAPILQKLGVPELPAHMFVFYFSILADATPPVSVASYAAASIARCSPMAAGVVAFRLAIAGFVVGFSYLHSSALLLQDSWSEIIGEFLANAAGLTLLAAGFFGFFRAPLPMALRLPLIPFGIALALADAVPVWYRVATALAVLLVMYVAQKAAAEREGQAVLAERTS
ncbi:TRAP transporter fused permease subunit [Phreatobacter aquaticus]|uniref:TRAP transporter fused permease subunit n=1 Tax=Phreatobacter aquaticus TaxID=2570229 RepID=A0A4D7QQ89_9HYPH|nr:TRAP transporter fused permease subunit [Phreatobacter aquaticus]QCK86282.1 TRAP transporter fused permease subunit [Phreatobacter aquaticus]